VRKIGRRGSILAAARIAQLDHLRHFCGERHPAGPLGRLVNDDESNAWPAPAPPRPWRDQQTPNWASGWRGVPKMLAAGWTRRLGTDGPVCNNSLEPVSRKWKFSSLIQKVHPPGTPTCFCQPKQMLRMATINGAPRMGPGPRHRLAEVGKGVPICCYSTLKIAKHDPGRINPLGGNVACGIWCLLRAVRMSPVSGRWQQLVAEWPRHQGQLSHAD